MKKKILLFASTILASMALAVSAYAAPTAEGNTEDDAAQILAEALQHTLKPTDADYALYDIDGNEPGLTVDVTANDAALAFKRSIVKTQFYLEVKAGEFTQNIALVPYSGSVDSAEASVKDMVEDYLAIGANKAETKVKEKAYAKVQDKVMSYINKVHFYSGSEKLGEIYLKSDTGWAIFADAIAPMLNGKDATLIAAKYDKEAKEASGSAQIADLYLPGLVADDSLSFKEAQNAYLAARDQAVNLNADEVPANIKETAANAAKVGNAATKYGAKLTLNEGTAFEKVYTYNKDGDLTSFNQLVDDATGIYDYNTVTIKTINDILGTGDTFTEVESNGETKKVYGTAKLEISGSSSSKTGTVQLVKKK
ncbi:MAG: hypothetical protein IKS17_00560 [Firmicutes bacterium]|nr:hypothetical protein [Bacillota bacterium]